MARKPGIGIDFDGVIADTNALKSRWIRRHLRRRIPPWQADRTSLVRLIGRRNYDRISPHVYNPQTTLSLPAVPGVRAALRALAPRFRLFVITARKGSILRGCRDWMRKNGLDGLVARYLSGGHAVGATVRKTELCARHGIRVLIDDDERHFRAGGDPSVIGALFKGGCDGKVRVPRGALLFRGWPDLLEYLRSLDFSVPSPATSSRARPRTVSRRVP